MQIELFSTARPALNADRIITLNCGVGRDSITLMCLLAEGKLTTTIDGEKVTVKPSDIDAVVFADTGAEWKHTYNVIPNLRTMCDKMGVRFVILNKGEGDVAEMAPAKDWREINFRAEMGAYHYRPAIMEDFASRSTVASLGKGDCTMNNKIGPIRRFINDLSHARFGLNNRQWAPRVSKGTHKPHVTIIGIAADETSRLEHGGVAPKYVTEAYPLVDMGIAKADEAPILARHGLAHVRKSGCFMCPYQPLSWYWALSVTAPELFANVVAYEAKSLAKNPNMSLNGAKSKGRILTIDEQVARWREANPTATVDGVLNKEYSRCDKDARAQRRADKALVQIGKAA